MSKNLKRLTKEDILGLPDVPEKEINIEEWGFSIKIKGMSKGMAVKLGRLLKEEDLDAFQYQIELLKECVSDPELDDDLITELYKKDSKVVDKIFVEISNINGVGGSAEDADQF
jgi:hypothetical protein